MIDTLGIGGAEKLLANTLSILSEYNHIVCYLSEPNESSLQLKAERVICLGFKKNADLLKCVFTLKKIIGRHKPALIHAHLLKSTWVARLAANGNIPLVFTIHNFLSEDAFKVNRLSYFFEKLSYSKRQSIVSVSTAALNDYDAWIGVKGRKHVLYNVIDDSFFLKRNQKECYPSKPEIKLVAVGNLRRQKNYTSLVNAFIFLKNSPVTLTIYGQGEDLEAIQEIIKKHALPIELKGQLTTVSHILKNYDAFILPSLFEGYGIAPVEAMAIGLPLILSDLEVFREITANKAIFFNPRQPKSIANAIIEFSQMSNDYKNQIVEVNKARASLMASKQAFKNKIQEIYSEIINY